MLKKWIILMIISIVLIGCSNSSNEIAEYKLELENINVVLNQRNEIIAGLNDRIKDLKHQNLEEVNKSNEKVSLIKEEVSLLYDEKAKLEIKLEEYRINNSSFIDIDLRVIADAVDGIDNARVRFNNLNEEIITRSEAMLLYTQAQSFHSNYFVFDMFKTLSPKNDYDYYTELGFDLDIFENWYLMKLNDEPMKRVEFDHLILSYFTNEILEEYTKRYVTVLIEGNEEEPIPKRPRFLVYKDYMLKQWLDSGSTNEEKLLVNQSIFQLVSISDDWDSVVYKASIPKLNFDFLTGKFDSVEYIEEILEFKRTEDGWRLNNIPKSYIE